MLKRKKLRKISVFLLFLPLNNRFIFVFHLTMYNKCYIMTLLEKGRDYVRQNLKYIIGIITPLIMLFLFFHYIVSTYKIPSASMENSIMEEDTVFANHLAYKIGDISYGDIIVFKKDGESNNLIKRVIGLPGDQIQISNGKLYRNGTEVVEDYVIGNTLANTTTDYMVPNNSVFVLGDNRENSKDSRYWNDPFISVDNIIARAYMGFGFSPKIHFYFL